QWYNNVNTSITDSDNFHNAYFVGMSVSWNIFDGGVSYAQHEQAVYQREQAEAAVNAALLHAPYDLDYWKRRYKYNANLYMAKISDVERAEESLRLATLGLKAGTQT